jgi:putative heme-binding domain-containing protein
MRIVESAFLGSTEPETAKALAEFLARKQNVVRREELAEAAIGYMDAHRSLFQSMTTLLTRTSGTNYPVKAVEGRIDSAERERALAFWRNWFEGTFGHAIASAAPQNPEKSDEEVRRQIVGERLPRGDSGRGGRIYETLQCNTCHGGGVTPGREGGIFGPDLAGVTRRLSRIELADSLVYPSKQVPDRFKGFEVTLKIGGVLTGFVTEQNSSRVTFVERDRVRQLARSDIESMTPQKNSLMPEKLLNRLSDQELADLLAFLEK